MGLPEIILFGIVALLIFGPKKLPEMGRSLGKGMREFKDSVSGTDKPTELDGSTRASIARMDDADREPNPFDDVAPATNGDAPATLAR